MASQMTADALNRLTSIVISNAISVHRYLGPGLLESAYLACLLHDLMAAALRIETQRSIPLVYRGVKIDCVSRRPDR